MNRKNTILLAVFINAGLLVVLFVTALTSQEEISVPPTHEMGAAPKAVEMQAEPLFQEEIDLAMRQPVAPPEPLPQVIPEPVAVVPTPKPAEELVVHQLPPLVPETVVAVAPAPAPAPVKAEPAFEQVVVKKGDSLEKIAKEHKTTVDELIKVNHLATSFLRIGQVIKIPVVKQVAAKAAKPAVPEKREAGPDYYTVKVGDNPWTIAMKNHIKVDELLKLNGLNDEKARKLKPGDRLRIR